MKTAIANQTATARSKAQERAIRAARDWVCGRAVLTQGYYLESPDEGQPNPSFGYCRKHAIGMADRLTRRRGVQYYYCEAWSGDDTMSWCAIKPCGIALDNGGLTDDGVKWALGCDEENPVAFVADVDELALAAGSMVHDNPLWDLWLSQVLRRRSRSKAKHLAFEAAWLAGERAFALRLLQPGALR